MLRLIVTADNFKENRPSLSEDAAKSMDFLKLVRSNRSELTVNAQSVPIIFNALEKYNGKIRMSITKTHPLNYRDDTALIFILEESDEFVYTKKIGCITASSAIKNEVLRFNNINGIYLENNFVREIKYCNDFNRNTLCIYISVGVTDADMKNKLLKDFHSETKDSKLAEGMNDLMYGLVESPKNIKEKFNETCRLSRLVYLMPIVWVTVDLNGGRRLGHLYQILDMLDYKPCDNESRLLFNDILESYIYIKNRIEYLTDKIYSDNCTITKEDIELQESIHNKVLELKQKVEQLQEKTLL